MHPGIVDLSSASLSFYLKSKVFRIINFFDTCSHVVYVLFYFSLCIQLHASDK